MIRQPIRAGLLAAAGVCAAALVAGSNIPALNPHGQKDWRAPESERKRPNPVPAGEPAVKAGRETYMDNCAQCHGDSGKGDGPEAEMYSVTPADFTDAHMMKEMTDGEIFWKMSEGRKPMPSFKKRLSEEQRWQLVHFLRTFSAGADPPPKAAEKKSAAKKSTSKKQP